MLGMMATAVSFNTGRAVGFVLDADEAPQNRWRAVRGRLDDLGLALPSEIPSDGYVENAKEFRARVGVWLLPDNRQSGALEEFLEALIELPDPLLPWAREATDGARVRGAAFPEGSLRKAVLHTWLAWQARPGVPYGTGVAAEYFKDDRPAAASFLRWFARLFNPVVQSSSATRTA